MDKSIEELLCEPFDEQDVEWRVQSSGINSQSKPWVMVIPYITNRAIQKRLDDVFGVFGWQDEYKETLDGKGMLCGITVFKDGKKITKWDGARVPLPPANGRRENVDPVKTVLSNSEKRAAVKFGIGRYLYNLDEEFALCKMVVYRNEVPECGNFIKINTDKVKMNAYWIPPELPIWAKPYVKADELIDAIEKAETIIDLKVAFTEAYRFSKSFDKPELLLKAVESKDQRKITLSKKYEDEENKVSSEILSWIEEKCKQGIWGANNESVLSINRKKIKSELNDLCDSYSVKTMEFQPLIEQNYQEKLLKLNNGER